MLHIFHHAYLGTFLSADQNGHKSSPLKFISFTFDILLFHDIYSTDTVSWRPTVLSRKIFQENQDYGAPPYTYKGRFSFNLKFSTEPFPCFNVIFNNHIYKLAFIKAKICCFWPFSCIWLNNKQIILPA